MKLLKNSAFYTILLKKYYSTPLISFSKFGRTWGLIKNLKPHIDLTKTEKPHRIRNRHINLGEIVIQRTYIYKRARVEEATNTPRGPACFFHFYFPFIKIGESLRLKDYPFYPTWIIALNTYTHSGPIFHTRISSHTATWVRCSPRLPIFHERNQVKTRNRCNGNSWFTTAFLYEWKISFAMANVSVSLTKGSAKMRKSWMLLLFTGS